MVAKIPSPVLGKVEAHHVIVVIIKWFVTFVVDMVQERAYGMFAESSLLRLEDPLDHGFTQKMRKDDDTHYTLHPPVQSISAPAL